MLCKRKDWKQLKTKISWLSPTRHYDILGKRLRARTTMVLSANTQLKHSRSQSCLRQYKDFLEEFLLVEEYLA